MKNLRGLLAFVEIAASGSLTAAAARLEVTPAAVSKSLATLERQLGVRLFSRSTRRLSITHEGERFLARAQPALRALNEAVAGVSQAATMPAGRVRISVGMAFGRRWVLPVLPALAQSYPQLSIDVDLDNRPTDLVAAGFDIGIRGGIIEDSSLVARRVCALPLGLFASPAYLQRAGVPAAPEDLALHRCAAARLTNAGPIPWRFTRPGGRRFEYLPQPQLTVSDPEALIDFAIAGAGVVQAGLQHALPHLRAGTLMMLFPGVHDPGEREVVLHYPHRRYLAPRVRVVVDALLAHFQRSEELRFTTRRVVEALPGCVAAAAVRAGTGRGPGSRPGGKRGK